MPFFPKHGDAMGGLMKKYANYRLLALSGALALCLPLRSTQACTTVQLPSSPGHVVAKSYDWHQGHGSVLINLRGIEKTSLTLKPFDRTAQWTSAYGSLTFNQYGREFPLGGINEKGLVVEVMVLPSTKHRSGILEPTVNELQWMQLQLDQYATVAEVVAHVDDVRISAIKENLHYMVCDAAGECATIEFIGGTTTVHHGAIQPPTLTNSEYEVSTGHLMKFVGFGGPDATPTDDSSLSRFVRASTMAKLFDPAGIVGEVEAAFGILDSVGGTSDTKFHLVYEPKSAKANFRTLTHKKIKWTDLSQFDLDCDPASDKTQILDMNQDLDGEIKSHFVTYTEAANRAMIDQGFKDVENQLPASLKETVVQYPSQQKCK